MLISIAGSHGWEFFPQSSQVNSLEAESVLPLLGPGWEKLLAKPPRPQHTRTNKGGRCRWLFNVEKGHREKWVGSVSIVNSPNQRYSNTLMAYWPAVDIEWVRLRQRTKNKPKKWCAWSAVSVRWCHVMLQSGDCCGGCLCGEWKYIGRFIGYFCATQQPASHWMPKLMMHA